RLTDQQRAELLQVADSNHVIIRSLRPVGETARTDGRSKLADWAQRSIVAESDRIHAALARLSEICTVLEGNGCPVTVMKTLEHWPDLGNDLDLYTTSDDRSVVDIMKKNLQATVEPRSWGDRLAHKWNFAVPGLKESVEVHVKRLGQTGEHVSLAERFVRRRQRATVDGHSFWTPAPEEGIRVETPQRMYRHFYFRICDIANIVSLVESGMVDYTELQRASESAGIWPGVASFLKIVSDYVARYCGQGLE